MTRRLLPFALVPLLAGCAISSSHTSAKPPTVSHSPAVTGSPSSQPSAAAPYVPHTAHAVTARWHLPYAAGRQALVAAGSGAVIVAGGLIAGDQSTAQAVRVDLAHGRVSPMASLAVPVHDVAGGLAGSTPVVVGGGNATEQDVVQAYRGNAWHVVSHLPTTRSDLSIVQRGGTPLVIGGYDGANVPTTILTLGPAGSSRALGRLVNGVRYAATAVLHGRAYVFGGEVNGAELGDVQAVDTRTGRTRLAGHLPVPLGHAMAVTLGERILLMGGRVTPDQQTGAMWWFDPATGRFSPAGRLPHPLSDAAVGSTGHTAYLLGGESPSVTADVVRIDTH